MSDGAKTLSTPSTGKDTAVTSRNLNSAELDCPFKHCTILVVVRDSHGTGVPQVGVKTGSNDVSTGEDGRYFFAKMDPGDHSVTVKLGDDDKKKYVWTSHDGKAKTPRSDSDSLTRNVPGNSGGLFPFWVLELARPTVKVVRQDNNAAIPGVGVKLEGANVYDLGDTQASGVAVTDPGKAGLVPDDYTVKLTIKAPDDVKYKVVDPGIQKLTAGFTGQILVQLIALAKPKVKVTREDNHKPVKAIGVKLKLNADEYTYSDTKDDGVGELPANNKWLLPGQYTVTVKIPDKDVDWYRYVDTGPITVAPAFEGEIALELKPLGVLVVEVYRHDGTPLSARVGFNLAGPTARNNQTTNPPAQNKPPNVDTKQLKGLDPGPYTVTLQQVTDILKQGALAKEWELAPKDTGSVNITVEAPPEEKRTATGEITPGDKIAKVSFVLTKYDKIQFIAFNIKPTTKFNKAGIEQYLGSDSAKKDIDKRCAVMTAAMQTALKDNSVDTTSTILKVFMAPEFFFRGADGAYPFEDVSRVLQNSVLKKEVVKPAYKDWLFVFGTAIGYLKHEAGLTPAKYQLKVVGTGKSGVNTFLNVTGGKKNAVGICAAILDNAGAQYQWKVKQGSRQAAVVKSTELNATTYKLELDSNAAFGNKDLELTEPSGAETRFLLRISNVNLANPTKLRIVAELDRAEICSRISKAGGYEWQVVQGNTIAGIASSTKISDTEYELTLAGNDNFNLAPCYIIEPVATEVLNVAFVKKGGPDPAPQDKLVREGGLKEALVYKEYVSGIDYIKAVTAGKVVLHEEQRIALPTMGSTDVKGQSPNTDSEVNKTGLGGGSVFTVDGITFGLEVCLDHRTGKLYKYTGTTAATAHKAGDPKIQVHLIPSWGMSIGLVNATVPPVSCVNNGLVFNVDGSRCESVARINDGQYSCDKHTTVVANAPAKCTVPCGLQADAPETHYWCAGENKWTNADPCPDCGNPTAAQVWYACQKGHLQLAAGVCNTPCDKDLQLMGTALNAISGPTDVSLSGLDWLTVTQSDYFKQKGTILVYPVQNVPAADTY